MNLEKSSWKAFLKNKEFMYVGAPFNKSIAVVVDAIEKYVEPPFEVNRTFVGGVTDIKFKRPDGEISHLSKRGKVYTLGKYFLIHDESNMTIIVYRIK